MLADRHYMREPSYGPRMSLTVILLIINVVVFVVECAVYGAGPGLSPNLHQHDWFALSLDGLKHGYVWQLLTYQFMHAGFLHLLFNGWSLYVFGRAVEDTIGKSRFLALYLASGVFGGLLQEAAAWTWPLYYNNYFGGPVVGASAAILGVVAAFAMLYPEHQIQLFLLFIIPVKLRAKHLLFFSLLLATLGISFPNSIFGGQVAHAAHMGGILMGLFYIQYAMRWRFSSPWKRRSSRPAPRELVTASNQRKPGLRIVPTEADFSPADFISREVDPILEKISAHGIQSLNERERKILEAARSKMGKQ